MYNLLDIQGIHLELSGKCQAKCPQCPRYNSENGKVNSYISFQSLKNSINKSDSGGFSIPSSVLDKVESFDEISLQTFVKWFPPKFVSQLNYLYMCGNFGDPIFAKDCLKIFAYLRIHNRTMRLSLHTNGGFRPKDWWEKLAKLRVIVNFAIDGLSDTHSLYRVNTNWETIIKNASYFINAGGIANWQMIVFKHNEHQITDCAKLAKSLKFNSFECRHTTRCAEHGQKKMPVMNPKGEVTHYLEPSTKSLKLFDEIHSHFSETNMVNRTIECPAQASKEIYVSANGAVVPCCFMIGFQTPVEGYNSEEDLYVDYKNKISMYPNLYKESLKEIFDSGYFKKIEKTWNEDSLMVCSKACGKINSNSYVNYHSRLTYIISF